MVSLFSGAHCFGCSRSRHGLSFKLVGYEVLVRVCFRPSCPLRSTESDVPDHRSHLGLGQRKIPHGAVGGLSCSARCTKSWTFRHLNGAAVRRRRYTFPVPLVLQSTEVSPRELLLENTAREWSHCRNKLYSARSQLQSDGEYQVIP